MPGDAFFGQDAFHEGLKPSYRDNGDVTISDLNTALVWQKTPELDRKLTFAEAKARAVRNINPASVRLVRPKPSQVIPLIIGPRDTNHQGNGGSCTRRTRISGGSPSATSSSVCRPAGRSETSTTGCSRAGSSTVGGS